MAFWRHGGRWPFYPRPSTDECLFEERTAEETFAPLDRPPIDAGETVSVVGSTGTMVFEKFHRSESFFYSAAVATTGSFYVANAGYAVMGSGGELGAFSFPFTTAALVDLTAPDPAQLASLPIPPGTDLDIRWTGMAGQPLEVSFFRDTCSGCATPLVTCMFEDDGSAVLPAGEIARVRSLASGTDHLRISRIVEETGEHPGLVAPFRATAQITYYFEATE